MGSHDVRKYILRISDRSPPPQLTRISTACASQALLECVQIWDFCTSAGADGRRVCLDKRVGGVARHGLPRRAHLHTRQLGGPQGGAPSTHRVHCLAPQLPAISHSPAIHAAPAIKRETHKLSPGYFTYFLPRSKVQLQTSCT